MSPRNIVDVRIEGAQGVRGSKSMEGAQGV